MSPPAIQVGGGGSFPESSLRKTRTCSRRSKLDLHGPRNIKKNNASNLVPGAPEGCILRRCSR
eukprot:8207157-Alexandrium_andersonii.AAC.1